MNPNDAMKALFSKRSRKLAMPQVREVVDALDEVTVWAAVFVREAMRLAPEGHELTHWNEALTQLERLKAFDPKLPVKPAWLLAAMQAATVSDWPTIAVLVALAKEGSDASRDALLADFERSVSSEEGLMVGERVRELKRYGKGIALCQTLLTKYAAVAG